MIVSGGGSSLLRRVSGASGPFGPDEVEDDDGHSPDTVPATSIDWSRDDDWTDEEADVNDTDPWDEDEDADWLDDDEDDWGV